MTEAELQEHVRYLCHDLRLYHYHTHDSRRSTQGFPDSFIMNCTTGKFLFRELKSASGQLTSEQRVFGYRARAGGADWAVWRPADLHAGRIQHELTELAGLIRRTA